MSFYFTRTKRKERTKSAFACIMDAARVNTQMIWSINKKMSNHTYVTPHRHCWNWYFLFSISIKQDTRHSRIRLCQNMWREPIVPPWTRPQTYYSWKGTHCKVTFGVRELCALTLFVAHVKTSFTKRESKHDRTHKGPYEWSWLLRF